MEEQLAVMLDAQRALQRRLDYDFAAMSTSDRVAYAREMVLALTDELHEFLGEVSWKSWASSTFYNEDAAFGELIDAWHFMLNLLWVTRPGLTATELADQITLHYDEKRRVNHERQDAGYDGVSTKCPKCRRAVDDVSTELASDRRCWLPIPSPVDFTVDMSDTVTSYPAGTLVGYCVDGGRYAITGVRIKT